jgi:hypothetical protein
MNIPASNLKVSMEMSSEQYQKISNELQLDKIIEK